MTYQAFEKASNRLLDSVWTMTFRQVSDFSVEILAYSRDDDDGYKYEHLMPSVFVMEDDDRNITHIEINGYMFAVENPKYIFSY